MGGNIPRKIKLQVIQDWLSGNSRDDTAINNSISTGSVSNIIQESRRKEIIDIDLLRTTALMMKKAGLEINDLSSTVRLRNLLNNLDLPEEQVEKFLLELSIYNYKRSFELYP